MQFFKNHRNKLISDIACQVINQLESNKGWETFLPPVAVGDAVYMITLDGKIYTMRYDKRNEMEIIIKIRG